MGEEALCSPLHTFSEGLVRPKTTVQTALLVELSIKLIFSFSYRFFGGGRPTEEEDRIIKGDDVIVELDATLEDLYMGGSLKARDMYSF